MQFLDSIHTFPAIVKKLILAYVICLSFGYFTGFKFVRDTTNLAPEGIETNYLGNEDKEDATEMIFKRSEQEILTTVHTHVLSFSTIFLSLGVILLVLPINQTLRKFLIIEPFVSTIVTFGGIWLMWKGVIWLKYLVMVSGIMITTTFVADVLLIIYYCIRKTNGKDH